MFFSEEHTKTIFAQPFLFHAGVSQEILEFGRQRAVLFHLHDDQIGNIRIATAQPIVKPDSEINGDALGFGFVHKCNLISKKARLEST